MGVMTNSSSLAGLESRSERDNAYTDPYGDLCKSQWRIVNKLAHQLAKDRLPVGVKYVNRTKGAITPVVSDSALDWRVRKDRSCMDATISKCYSMPGIGNHSLDVSYKQQENRDAPRLLKSGGIVGSTTLTLSAFRNFSGPGGVSIMTSDLIPALTLLDGSIDAASVSRWLEHKGIGGEAQAISWTDFKAVAEELLPHKIPEDSLSPPHKRGTRRLHNSQTSADLRDKSTSLHRDKRRERDALPGSRGGGDHSFDILRRKRAAAVMVEFSQTQSPPHVLPAIDPSILLDHIKADARNARKHDHHHKSQSSCTERLFKMELQAHVVNDTMGHSTDTNPKARVVESRIRKMRFRDRKEEGIALSLNLGKNAGLISRHLLDQQLKRREAARRQELEQDVIAARATEKVAQIEMTQRKCEVEADRLKYGKQHRELMEQLQEENRDRVGLCMGATKPGTRPDGSPFNMYLGKGGGFNSSNRSTYLKSMLSSGSLHQRSSQAEEFRRPSAYASPTEVANVGVHNTQTHTNEYDERMLRIHGKETKDVTEVYAHASANAVVTARPPSKGGIFSPLGARNGDKLRPLISRGQSLAVPLSPSVWLGQDNAIRSWSVGSRGVVSAAGMECEFIGNSQVQQPSLDLDASSNSW